MSSQKLVMEGAMTGGGYCEGVWRCGRGEGWTVNSEIGGDGRDDHRWRLLGYCEGVEV